SPSEEGSSTYGEVAIARAPSASIRSSTGPIPSHWNHSGITVTPSDGVGGTGIVGCRGRPCRLVYQFTPVSRGTFHAPSPPDRPRRPGRALPRRGRADGQRAGTVPFPPDQARRAGRRGRRHRY